MITKDHTGAAFSLTNPPERIVCLVPSITELLYDLGLGDKVVGRTKFCIYPEDGFPKAKIVGGTKNIHIDKIKALNPDLVIANKEENVKEQVLPLNSFTNVFTTIVKDTKDALKMITDIGEITNTKTFAQSIIHQFKDVNDQSLKNQSIKMAYLIWRKPYMTVGGDTFISAFMEDFGFVNCFKNELRYPTVNLDQIKDKKPDVILLSSEPFPFSETHLSEIKEKTGIETQLIDGSICSWYGSRMLKAKDFFKTFVQQIGS